MVNCEETIIKAFPGSVNREVLSLLSKIDLSGSMLPNGSFTVQLGDESVEIPSRVYFEEPKTPVLNAQESLILHCLFTRHHNGYVRQKNLAHIIKSDKYFVTPFIMQLLGEYVVEILDTIENNLNSSLLSNLARFSLENPVFFRATKSRMISYWDHYYRVRTWPKNKKEIKNYVGFKIIKAIENFAT